MRASHRSASRRTAGETPSRIWRSADNPDFCQSQEEYRSTSKGQIGNCAAIWQKIILAAASEIWPQPQKAGPRRFSGEQFLSTVFPQCPRPPVSGFRSCPISQFRRLPLCPGGGVYSSRSSWAPLPSPKWQGIQTGP